MLSRATLALWLTVATATAAWPCNVAGQLPGASELLDRAAVVVRVRADRLLDSPGRRDNVLVASSTQVQFSVLKVLKGTIGSPTLTFNGYLTQRDDFNRRPVPYDAVRSGGESGCFALNYRQGAEYLLLLSRAGRGASPEGNELTPYWSALGATNEQLRGDSDQWIEWVAQYLGKTPQ